MSSNPLSSTPSRQRFYVKVIRIKATDSPNVRLGLAQRAAGKTPTNEIIVPGVMPYDEYQKRRATWDKVRQCVGLDAEFWEGADALLFPPEWLNRCEERARELVPKVRRAVSMGVDPAEGGDKTAFTVVDWWGVIEQVSLQTPSTNDIPNRAIGLMRKHAVQPSNVLFDRGGGGKQAADQMRERGYGGVRTVAFGEPVTPAFSKGTRDEDDVTDQAEARYQYKNRRAQMYHMIRLLMERPQGFGIPSFYPELRRQLAPIPLTYDREGRLYLLPKSKSRPDSKEKTLIDLIGHSPDEADSLALAVYGLHKPAPVASAGAF